MGKIFGISKLPVSTLDKALAPSQGLVKPVKNYTYLRSVRNMPVKKDTFVKNSNRTYSTTHK